MLDPMIASARWKKIKESLDLVKDPILKECMMAEYQHRAIEEWGFCPDKEIKERKDDKPILSPEQQAFYDKIQMSLEYGCFKQDEQVSKEAKARMKQFIESGGSFKDLPDDLQNKFIKKLYLEAFTELIDEGLEQLEKLKKN